ncbi:MAG: T9SS type A sorting domain-containing protein [Chthoniobacterales bacterium]
MKTKKLTYLILSALSLTAAALNAGSIPEMNVVVSDANGRLAYRGRTSHDGMFHTRQLAQGNYVVQLSSNNPALNGRTFALVASAGTKKTVATAVPGEKFGGGGVAMRVAVNRETNISGQVAPSAAGIAYRQDGRVVTGWEATHVGSNLKMTNADNAERFNVNIWTPDEVYRFQERTSQPSGH